MKKGLWFVIRRILFLVDAEKVHHFASTLLIVLSARAPWFLRLLSRSCQHQSLEVAGRRFRNRVGLAAGFDKNAELVYAAYLLGFGFIEVGTVTLRPQSGNPKPRLGRDAKRRSLLNRMGFNNQGAAAVRTRLLAHRKVLPAGFAVGVNLGLNKDTPHDQAAVEYAETSSFFVDCCDYMVLNVSSPNTPGLRSLQTPEKLLEICSSVRQVIKESDKTIPLFVKLAPEIEGSTLESIVQTLESKKVVDGFVLTNTLSVQWKNQAAGLSGEALREISRSRLIELRSMSPLPIISVGGIHSKSELQWRVDQGADLVQIYTGWIYEGPCLLSKLLS